MVRARVTLTLKSLPFVRVSIRHASLLFVPDRTRRGLKTRQLPTFAKARPWTLRKEKYVYIDRRNPRLTVLQVETGSDLVIVECGVKEEEKVCGHFHLASYAVYFLA